MTFIASSTISNLSLGELTKILSKGAVYPQMARQSAIWKKVLSKTEGQAKGREQRFAVLTGRGPASFQFSAFNGSFPTFQASDVVEGVVHWKDFDLTVAYDLSLQNKTGEELVSYAKPYAIEMQQKGIAAARTLSANAYGDGSGVIGVVGSVSASTSTGLLTVVLNTTSANADRSHAGWFEKDDFVKFATPSGVAHNTIDNATDTVANWKIVSASVDTGVVVMQPLDANGAPIAIASATLGATDPTVGDYIYRKGAIVNDLSSASAITDWNLIGLNFAGLGSLTADDGRVVNGLTMSGILAGSRRDVGGQLLSSRDFQKLISYIMRVTSGETNGQNLTYSEALMHDITYDMLVEQNEANRTWYNIQDPNTGVSRIGHRHRKQFVEFIEDEFCPLQRIYLLPDQKGPLVFLGTDLQQVKVGNATEWLKPDGNGGYSKTAMTFMSGSGAMMTHHPAALGVIENFSVTA